MNEDPGKILAEARKAFKQKNYEKALESYEWFFENSTKIKPSYYGVRLSYCLSEWVELSKKYPKALDALLEKKKTALENFIKCKSENSFHDFASICEYIECSEESVHLFLEIHNKDKELAKKIFRFVYEPLAKESKWELCRTYLGNGFKRYQEIIEIFDRSIKFSKEKTEDQSKAIESDAIKYAKQEIAWLLNMLNSVNATAEYNSALERIKKDMTSRGYEVLYQDIIKNLT